MGQILSFTNIKKNSTHLKISTDSALPTFLSQTPTSERVGASIVVKHWPSSRCQQVSMQLIASHRNAHNSQSFPTRSVTQNHLGATFYSEDITLWSHLQSKIHDFTPKVPSSDRGDLRLQLRHFYSPTLKTYNAPLFKAGNYEKWRDSLHAIPTIQLPISPPYNISAHEGRTVIGTLSALIPSTAQYKWALVSNEKKKKGNDLSRIHFLDLTSRASQYFHCQP